MNSSSRGRKYYHLPPLQPPLLGEAEAVHVRVTLPSAARLIEYVLPFEDFDVTVYVVALLAGPCSVAPVVSFSVGSTPCSAAAELPDA
jgi:hypothetical protein